MAKNFVEELKWRGMLAQMMPGTEEYLNLSLIHISEPTRLRRKSRMPSSA